MERMQVEQFIREREMLRQMAASPKTCHACPYIAIQVIERQHHDNIKQQEMHGTAM